MNLADIMTNLPVIIQRLSSDQFASIRDEWNVLLKRSAATSPFLLWEWMHTWWTNFGEAHTLLMLSFRRDGRLIGLAPLHIRTSSAGIRRVRILSDDLADHLDLIAAPGEETAVVEGLWDYLRENTGIWDLIQLLHIREGATALVQPRAAASGVCWKARIQENLCRVVSVGKDFSTYLEMRPGLSFRRKFSKKVRRLMETEKAELVRPDSGQVEEFMRIFIAMHERRSVQMGRRSAFLDVRAVRFIGSAAKSLFDLGVLRLVFLEVKNQATACYVGLEMKNRLFLFQSGIDPDWMHLSSGAVLTYLVIKDGFERGLSEIDFLSGEESYKDIWATDRRLQYDLFAYRLTMRGIAVAANDTLRRSLWMALRILTRSRLAAAPVDAAKRMMLRARKN